jgi:hypothetical protein
MRRTQIARRQSAIVAPFAFASAARKRRDYATILTKINRPSQARGPSPVRPEPPSASLLLAHRIKAKRALFDEITTPARTHAPPGE